jgi:hypothetical protein
LLIITIKIFGIDSAITVCPGLLHYTLVIIYSRTDNETNDRCKKIPSKKEEEAERKNELKQSLMY